MINPISIHRQAESTPAATQIINYVPRFRMVK